MPQEVVFILALSGATGCCIPGAAPVLLVKRLGAGRVGGQLPGAASRRRGPLRLRLSLAQHADRPRRGVTPASLLPTTGVRLRGAAAEEVAGAGLRLGLSGAHLQTSGDPRRAESSDAGHDGGRRPEHRQRRTAQSEGVPGVDAVPDGAPVVSDGAGAAGRAGRPHGPLPRGERGHHL